MHDRVSFSSFDPLFCETPQKCDICHAAPPIFLFEASIQDKRHDTAADSGFCCANCALRVLRKLAKAESRHWTEEEAAIRNQDLDSSLLHERIVNSF
jgi:hypothetical protein